MIGGNRTDFGEGFGPRGQYKIREIVRDHNPLGMSRQRDGTVQNVRNSVTRGPKGWCGGAERSTGEEISAGKHHTCASMENSVIRWGSSADAA